MKSHVSFLMISNAIISSFNSKNDHLHNITEDAIIVYVMSG
jgi:hypothetical protein